MPKRTEKRREHDRRTNGVHDTQQTGWIKTAYHWKIGRGPIGHGIEEVEVKAIRPERRIAPPAEIEWAVHHGKGKQEWLEKVHRELKRSVLQVIARLEHGVRVVERSHGDSDEERSG